LFSWLIRLTDWFARHTLSLTITLLIVLFLVLFFWDRLVVSIYPGHVGVLWRRFGGTVINKVYGEGTHLVLPLNIMYIYDVRWQLFRRSVTALTRDGLEVTIDLGLRYRVRSNSAPVLHKEAGPRYRETLLVTTLDSAARNVLGVLDAENLYVQRDPNVFLDERQNAHDVIESNLLERAQVEIGRRYLDVDDLDVLRLALPAVIQEAIQKKREEEQFALRYEFRLAQERQEAERKRIEAAGIRDFQNIISQGLTPGFLTFRGIEATLELAKSPNAKVLVYGDKTGLPLLLGTPSFGLGDQAQPK
jgi:regulator of protease activity HflC (stomatin/prohibitin superfamily)